MQTPVPEQVIFRMDWPNFLKSISPRDRELAEFLSWVIKQNSLPRDSNFLREESLSFVNSGTRNGNGFKRWKCDWKEESLLCKEEAFLYSSLNQ